MGKDLTNFKISIYLCSRLFFPLVNNRGDMKKNYEEPINGKAVCAQPFEFTPADARILEAEFYSEKDIDEVERNLQNVRYSISFFHSTTPENSFKKDLSADEAQNMLGRNNFISAVAQAILDINHYSVSRIYEAKGVKYVTCFM